MRKVYDEKDKKIMLLVINLILISLIILAIWNYSTNVNSNQLEDNKYSFMLSIQSQKKLTQSYLRNEQGYVNNWAKYIDDNDMNLDEAMTFLKTININSNRYVHIVDVETYDAYSSYYEIGDNQIDTYTNYKDYHSNFSKYFKNIIEKMYKNESDVVYVLGKYALKENGTYCISVGKKVNIITNNGGKDYLLLRIIPTESILSSWDMPAQYGDSQLALISSDGDYIVKTSEFLGESFISYIAKYNFDNNVGEKSIFTNNLKANTMNTLYYKNADGKDCIYFYTALDDNRDLYILGSIPLDNLKEDDDLINVTFLSICLFVLLMAIDSMYFIQINKRLKDALNSANKANLAKTDFLSTMSHDIRTPMNVVIGMNDLAYKYIEDPKIAREYLDKSYNASKQLLTLINDILDISKIESGKMILNMGTVSLRKLGQEIYDLMAPYASNKIVNLEADLNKLEDKYVVGDETRLKQIYVNLISNAIKYTPSNGSVIFSLSSKEKMGKCELSFMVKDNGVGMSSEFQKQMYSSFARAQDSRTSSTSGSGLGLTIVKEIVDCMYGEIKCDSKLNEGTTFTVNLLLSYTHDLEYVKDDNSEKSIEGLRILIAEDNDLNYEIIDCLLKDRKTINSRAKNGQECVALFKENKDDYDLILMDIQMPVKNGYEACKEIREIDRHIPIIAVSANAFVEDVGKSLSYGMNDHIAKPIDIDKLVSVIKKVL